MGDPVVCELTGNIADDGLRLNTLVDAPLVSMCEVISSATEQCEAEGSGQPD